MAKPGVVDIEIYQGDRYELYFRVRTQIWDELTSSWVKGPGHPLTGWTPTGEVRAARGTTDVPLATFVCSLADQVVDPGGVLCVLLPSATQILTDPAGYVYDIQLKLDADNVTTYVTGAIKPTKEVTRA